MQKSDTQKNQTCFFPLSPFNFVPMTRTPWGGRDISEIKRRYFKKHESLVPERVGESWEVSTDSQFMSNVVDSQLRPCGELSALLESNCESLLGPEIANRFGAHSPLLLKWLDAAEVLSVQVHPDNRNPQLKYNECGKPESWLVLNVDADGYIYLGFKENFSKSEIYECLSGNSPQDCLHRYKPSFLDYISVPPGCVHAVGPGVLIAEPQFVLPNKAGKTWRLSDWGRTYNTEGKRDPSGTPRELHFEEGFAAIDWVLPLGKKIERELVHNLLASPRFEGDIHNPFLVEVFTTVSRHIFKPLCTNQFSLLTVWNGHVVLTSTRGERCVVQGGQSAFISASAGNVNVETHSEGGSVGCAFFAIRPEAL